MSEDVLVQVFEEGSRSWSSVARFPSLEGAHAYIRLRSKYSFRPCRVKRIPASGVVSLDIDDMAKVISLPAIQIEVERSQTVIAPEPRPEFEDPDDFYSRSLTRPFRSPKVKDQSSFLISADPRLPCVYAIRCKANNGVYIGKAKSITARARQHSGKLGRNKHINRRMQADWNKYGAHSFSMEVYEACRTDSECIARELAIIHEFSISAPSRLYNIIGNKSLLA